MRHVSPPWRQTGSTRFPALCSPRNRSTHPCNVDKRCRINQYGKIWKHRDQAQRDALYVCLPTLLQPLFALFCSFHPLKLTHTGHGAKPDALPARRLVQALLHHLEMRGYALETSLITSRLGRALDQETLFFKPCQPRLREWCAVYTQHTDRISLVDWQGIEVMQGFKRAIDVSPYSPSFHHFVTSFPMSLLLISLISRHGRWVYKTLKSKTTFNIK